MIPVGTADKLALKLLLRILSNRVNYLDHIVCDLRIELDPRLLDKGLPRNEIGLGIAIPFICSHGIVGVRNGDYPGDLRDLITL